ncbi:prepilin-type N-terminal cleavage/methylation domain-containing protein [Ruegeria marina]|uniref:Type II secretion system protein H n=1 Tax=Ruegeria marina TaxID=639004 RepID=A0A1G7CE37_9RHOB|nr:prepilin-type N-terminal cleavage/methylation domain-containing protein [Ruegeria marina]SDE37559.1 type II secretion system protein H [Ruegeria marina]
MAEQLTPGDQWAKAGFTLVELLVVIAILSVLSVGSALLITRRPGLEQGDAAVFRDAHERLRSLAVHSGRAHGLYLDVRGWQLAEAGPDGWRSEGVRLAWQAPVRFRAERLSDPAARAPEIRFLPDGRSSAFEVIFGTGDGALRCRGDGWGGLSCGAG